MITSDRSCIADLFALFFFITPTFYVPITKRHTLAYKYLKHWKETNVLRPIAVGETNVVTVGPIQGTVVVVDFEAITLLFRRFFLF